MSKCPLWVICGHAAAVRVRSASIMKADLIVAGPAADVPKGRHDVFRRCKGSIASNIPGLTGARSHCADPLTFWPWEGPAIFCGTPKHWASPSRICPDILAGSRGQSAVSMKCARRNRTANLLGMNPASFRCSTGRIEALANVVRQRDQSIRHIFRSSLEMEFEHENAPESRLDASHPLHHC